MTNNIHSYKDYPLQDNNRTIGSNEILESVSTHRFVYIVCIIACLVLSYLYMLTSQPEWKIKSKILVDDLKLKQVTKVLGTGLTGAFNDQGASSSADNEIQVLKTNTLLANVVNSMDLNVIIRKVNGLSKKEIYDDAPFIVDIRPQDKAAGPMLFKIETIGGGKLMVSGQGETKVARKNVSVHFPDYNFMFGSKNTFIPGQKFEVEVVSKEAEVENLAKRLEVKLSDKNATAIDLTLEYSNPKKGEKILNEFMDTYLRQNLANKIKSDDSALNFITDRVRGVERELAAIEGQTEQYKRQNSISDLQSQSVSLINTAGNQTDRLNQVKVQLSVITDLQNALSSSDNHLLPASVAIQNEPNLVSAIARYNELLQGRQRLTLSYQDDNPIARNADAQIETAKTALLQSLSIFRKGLQISLNQLTQQSNSVNSNIRQIPGQQRISLDFSRQQALKEQLYVYLLQKKEETAIAKIATTSGARIIDPATSDLKPFKPQKPLIMLLGLVAGIAVSIGISRILDSLNEKVKNIVEIEEATKTKLLGEIVQSGGSSEIVIRRDSRTLISEEFRALRTNLQFASPQEGSKVILITSSRTGEGKTFMTLNLGMTLALASKRVVLLEMDLRKPKLREKLGLNPDDGLSSYINSNVDPASLIRPSGLHENCFIISSGPIPGNPSELLSHPRMEMLLSYLRENFQYILMDTAPAGVVSDALILGQFSDISLYLIRENYTEKRHLAMLVDLMSSRKLKNVQVILNGMNIKEKRKSIRDDGQGYYTHV